MDHVMLIIIIIKKRFQMNFTCELPSVISLSPHTLCDFPLNVIIISLLKNDNKR